MPLGSSIWFDFSEPRKRPPPPPVVMAEEPGSTAVTNDEETLSRDLQKSTIQDVPDEGRSL